MARDREVAILSQYLAPHLSPEKTPRLRALMVRGMSSEGTTFLNTLGDTLKGFASLTTLSLLCTCHRSMRDVQQLVCALPRLTHLYLDTVSWFSPAYDGCGDSSEGPAEGPALKYLRVSAVYPACMLPFLAWLSRTPTARSLWSLEIPSEARMGPEVLKHFGASVRHLYVPLRGLQPGSSLNEYTSLTSLTLYVGIDDLTWKYNELPELLETLPAPSRASLSRLELHVPYQVVSNGGAVLDVLARVDAVVFGGGSGVAERPSPKPEAECESGSEAETGTRTSASGSPNPSDAGPLLEVSSLSTTRSKTNFPALTEVAFIILSPSTLSEQDRADAEWSARLQLGRADRLGRLDVRFGRHESLSARARWTCVR
ncbi:hypothetical protein OH77DRAFT_987023 [Trametes cingulata]|nr:hypothetical protein OH77DRAFT_987023 [Trametes cingulata]